MKKLFYFLSGILFCYIVFCGVRVYKQRTDCRFIAKIIDARQELCNKISKISHIKDSCEYEIKKIEEQKKKEDKKTDTNSSKTEDNEGFYKNLKNKAEENLTILETKEKEMSSYILRCNKVFISKKLRKETNEYLEKYIKNKPELDKIVEEVETPFRKFKEEERKKKEEERKKKEEERKKKEEEEEKKRKEEEDKKRKEEEDKKKEEKEKNEKKEKEETEKKKQDEEK